MATLSKRVSESSSSMRCRRAQRLYASFFNGLRGSLDGRLHVFFEIMACGCVPIRPSSGPFT
eukprot:12891732-Prorocentrum_lima.AAC.1